MKMRRSKPPIAGWWRRRSGSESGTRSRPTAPARQPAVLWRHALLTLGATVGLLRSYVRFPAVIQVAVDAARAPIRTTRSRRPHPIGASSVEAAQLWRALAGVLSFAWAVTVVAMVFPCCALRARPLPWTRGHRQPSRGSRPRPDAQSEPGRHRPDPELRVSGHPVHGHALRI